MAALVLVAPVVRGVGYSVMAVPAASGVPVGYWPTATVAPVVPVAPVVRGVGYSVMAVSAVSAVSVVRGRSGPVAPPVRPVQAWGWPVGMGRPARPVVGPVPVVSVVPAALRRSWWVRPASVVPAVLAVLVVLAA